jgi:hypothetical protein
VIKLQKVDEVRYESGFVRWLLEHPVRVWMLPVFVIAFDREVEVKAMTGSVAYHHSGAEGPTLHLVSHKVVPAKSSSIDLSRREP